MHSPNCPLFGKSTIDLFSSNAFRIWFGERILRQHFSTRWPTGSRFSMHERTHQHPAARLYYGPSCGHICCMHEFNNIMHALFESNIILKRLAGIMLNRAIILLSAFPSSMSIQTLHSSDADTKFRSLLCRLAPSPHSITCIVRVHFCL